MSGVDFDISSYTAEELVNIIGLGGKLPLTNEKIVEKIESLKQQFEGKYKEDEYIIKLSDILNTIERTQEEDELFELSFLYNKNYTGDADKKKEWVKDEWNEWSVSEAYGKEFKRRVKELQKIGIEKSVLEHITNSKYSEALQIAGEAKDKFIFFFDEVGYKLKEYKKEEYSQNYEEEENEEGDIMNENEKILSQGNFAMPFWERTKFLNNQQPTLPKDYKNPLSKPFITKTINIDSQFRSIADPVECERCPDILEFYENEWENKNNQIVVASNKDGKYLITGISGNMLKQLDIRDGIPEKETWVDISFNKFISEVHKEWVDITMNYEGNNISVCNTKHIWYTKDASNNWNKGKISYLTNNNLSNTDISANWSAITSDFTGEKLFTTRKYSYDSSAPYGNFKNGGVCYSNDYAVSWIDLSNETIIYPYNEDLDMSQNWIDIEITGDGEKVYGIFENDGKYYIVKKNVSENNWEIINESKWDNTNTELINYSWNKIVTNHYGTKVFIIAKDHYYIWRSFNSGTSWSKIKDISIKDNNEIKEITGNWSSITCSMDGLKLAAWDISKGKLRFSENGGSVWNEGSEVVNVTADVDVNIVISDDGDRILGLDYNGNIFTSKKCVDSGIAMFDRSSNFTINLSEPIKNVVSIALKTVELPHSWNVFSENEGTNSFYVKKGVGGDYPTRIDISSGNYHYNDIFDTPDISLNIITVLNNAMENNSITDITFSYLAMKHKIAITNNNPNTNVTITWYDDKSNKCSNFGEGGKANYNLGWLLGFRKTKTFLGTSKKKEATTKLNLRGTKKVYISLDEFSNNRPPDDCISYENNSATFNMPSYYVKTTMGIEMSNGEAIENSNCWVDPDPPAGNCGKKYANKDLLSNLTSAQRYTIENIRNAINFTKQNLNKSPVFPNLMYTLQLKFDTTVPPAIQYTTDRYVLGDKKREYFGPITLRKFHIRLFNDRGYEIDMEDDWSFTLLIEQLYNNN